MVGNGLRNVFESVEQIDGPGQFAVRGSIIDIYTLTDEVPYRIDFWDDEIDNILDTILEDAYEICEKRWLKINPDIDLEKMEYTIVYLFNGTIGVLNYWINNDFSNKSEEIAKLVENLYYDGIKSLLNKKEN